MSKRYVATFEQGKQQWCVQVIEARSISWHKSKEDALDEAAFLNSHPYWERQSQDGTIHKYAIKPTVEYCVYCGEPDCEQPDDCPKRRQHMEQDGQDGLLA